MRARLTWIVLQERDDLGFGACGSKRCSRKHKTEYRPARVKSAGAYLQSAVVLIDDALRDPEPQAGTVHAFRGVEGIEDTFSNRLAHPVPCVCDGDTDAVVYISGPNAKA